MQDCNKAEQSYFMKTGKLDSLIEDLKKVLDKKSFEGIAVINYPRLLIQ